MFMKLKNIFFDFDGVIAESVSAKTDAFKEMYLQYGNEIADAVEEYHINHGGISRYEKFKYWEKLYFNRILTEEELEKMAQKFSDLVLEKVINSEEVSGAKYFLDKYHKTYNFWIITGTPTKEIKLITKSRGYNDYFIGIYGSPENKRYWSEFILDKFNLKREETIFLGDATTDQDAANHSKLHFALRETHENKTIFKDYKGLRFKDFYELEKKIFA